MSPQCHVAPSHVAIVGCGFSGTSAFFQLVHSYPVEKITIFEATGLFGPGYPYHPEECGDYLINNTTDSMCLVPANRRAFLDWLETRPDQAADLDEKGHLPRSLFGVFLQEVFAATRTAAAVKGIEVSLIPAEATAMEEDADGQVHIRWTGGTVLADMALLTTGRAPDIDAYEAPPAGSGAQYFANHICSQALDEISLDATIHLLGASLSAYDVVNRLFSPESGCGFVRDAAGGLRFIAGANRRKVVLCSRSGRLKKMQSRKPETLKQSHFNLSALREAAGKGGLDLSDVAALIKQEATANKADTDWAAVENPYEACADADALNQRAAALLEAEIEAARLGEGRNFLVDLFEECRFTIWDGFAEQLLTPEAERLYRKSYETAALSYHAACPIPTAERLLALMRAGRLEVVKGVEQVSLAADGGHYAIGHGFGCERATVLINATGKVDRDVTSRRQPELTKCLVARGHLRPYCRDGQALEGAAVDMQSFRLEGATNIYLANMLLWGPGFFTSSAFMMATVVERALKAAFKETNACP